MAGWDKKRDEQKERRYRTMAKDRLEAIEITQDIISEIEANDLGAIQEQIEDFKEEVRINGGYLLRDKDGNIQRDSYGAAMIRKLPTHIKKTLLDNMELRETNVKILISANTSNQIPLPPSGESKPGQLEGEVFDLESMPVGEDEPKDDK